MRLPSMIVIVLMTSCSSTPEPALPGDSPKPVETELIPEVAGLKLIQISPPLGAKPEETIWLALINESGQTRYWYGVGETPWHEVRRTERSVGYEIWVKCWESTAVEPHALKSGERIEFRLFGGGPPRGVAFDAVRLSVSEVPVTFEKPEVRYWQLSCRLAAP